MSELFYKISQALCERQDLTPADKLIFAILSNYRGDNETCWPSQTTIARKSGITEKTVRRCLTRLEQAGLLEVFRGIGTSNHYRTPDKITGVDDTNPGKNVPTTPVKMSGEPRTKLPTKRYIEKNHIKDSCGEPEKTSFAFVLKTGESWHLPQAKLDEYRESFPGIDLDRELRKAAQWTRDNDTKRKTAKGMPAFLSRWLNKLKPEAILTPQSEPTQPEMTSEEFRKLMGWDDD